MVLMPRAAKSAVLLGADVLVAPLCLYLALAQDAGSPMPAAILGPQAWTTLALALLLAVAAGAISVALGLPWIKLKAYESRGLALTGVQAAALTALGAALAHLIGAAVPAMAWLTFALLSFLGGAAWRFAALRMLLWGYRNGERRVRLAIYGAGTTGIQIARALAHDARIEPVLFVDDNPSLQRLSVAGLPVRAPADLPRLAAERGIDRVLLAMPSVAAPRRARLARALQDQGLDVQALPSFAQLVGHEALVQTLVTDAPDLILGRGRLDNELPGVCGSYGGGSVLVTGAGGSIGAELCRQVLSCKPARLILYEVSEPALHVLHLELAGNRDTRIVPVLGSVCDRALLERVLREHRVGTVLHAAAYKHVPLVESNVVAGVANNVLGTRVAAEAALAAGVPCFVLVSSDKAVRPKGVMGATKRAAELVLQDLAARPGPTSFSMVRFGNVIGSSGSVVPLFQEQIARGGPVTLTHGDMTRYFMTIPEAARLVLVAGSLAQGGDVFVLDMGEPISIRALARRMIELAGCTVRDEETPDGDIEITVTGLRPGEKLVEELLIDDDVLATPHPKILRARDAGLSEIEMRTMLRDLSQAVEAADEHRARAALLRWTACPARLGAARPAVLQVVPQPGPQTGAQGGSVKVAQARMPS